MNFLSKNKINPLALAIASSLAVVSVSADAAIVTLNLEGMTSAQVDIQAAESETKTSQAEVDAQSSLYSDTSSSDARARADNLGWFYSTSSGYFGAYYSYDGLAQQGGFDTSSVVKQRYQVQNSGVDQFFDFSFSLLNGSIDVNCGDGYGYGYGYGFEPAAEVFASEEPVDEIIEEVVEPPLYACSGQDQVISGYTAEILFNGNVIWESAAELFINANGIAFTSSGVSLNSYDGSNYYWWDAKDFTLDLGLVSANTSFTLDYIVKTYTQGSGDNYFNGYAQFGDPNGFGTQSITQFTSTTTEVNAPAMFGLLGLSLAGIFVRRRVNR